MNTAEIISKVKITLSLIYLNEDFDFVGWIIKTPCLFYFRRVKYNYVKETHDINGLLTLAKIVLASQHKRQPNKSLSRFVDNRPFPSSLVPLFQSESKCETILMKMTLTCMKIKLNAELIFIWMVSHLDSFWNRSTRELGNGLLKTRAGVRLAFQNSCKFAKKAEAIRGGG